MQTPVLATFFIDSFILLPLFAFLVVWLSFRLAKSYRARLRWIQVLAVFTLVCFWIVAGGLWFNKMQISALPLIGPWFRKFGDARSFMTNCEWYFLFGEDLISRSELANAGFWSKWNLLAMFYLFVVYPVSLTSAILARLIFFGRSEKQTGIFGLIPIPFFTRESQGKKTG